MKKLFSTALLVLVALTGLAQENNYTISGDMTPMIEEMSKEGVSIDSCYLAEFGSWKPITEKFALQGNKVAYSGKVEKPMIAALLLEMKIYGGVRTQRIPLLLEPGNIVIKQDNWMSCIVGGTPLNDSLFTATLEIGKVKEAGNADKDRQLIKDYILRHRDDLTAVLMLTAVDDAKSTLALIKQCGETVQQHPLTVQLTERLNTQLSRPQEGDMFKDFAVEYDGKTTRLSDYVGKGKYVLVDFWASWCGPCRAEIPKIIALYEKYKDRNFTALGVAVNDKPEATLRAIEKDKISYPQILNSQSIAPALYGFNSIPEIIIFAPDGTIVARSLRGEALENKLAEIFNDK